MRRAKVELYTNGDEWFWHLKASNGRIIADSGEGYATYYGVVRAVDRVVKAFGGDIKQMWVVLL